jgi:hypothetical protein
VINIFASQLNGEFMKEIVETLMLMWRCSWSWREQVIVALCQGKGDVLQKLKILQAKITNIHI